MVCAVNKTLLRAPGAATVLYATTRMSIVFSHMPKTAAIATIVDTRYVPHTQQNTLGWEEIGTSAAGAGTTSIVM
jgi:hypothetical protein